MTPLRPICRALRPWRRCVGLFRHRGVCVRHPGILIDQRAVAAGIDEALDALERKHAGAVAPLLRRVSVRITDRNDGVDTLARWSGGFFDRGTATVLWDEVAGGARVRDALSALLLAELEPSARPDIGAVVH